MMIKEPLLSEPLQFEGETFRANFPNKHFEVRHRLADHPLFTLERLLELAKTLPEADVEYNAGDVKVGQDPALTPQNGLSIAETVTRIKECSSWMVLKNVETNPEYAALLDQCLDPLRVYSDPIVGEMYKKVAFIFLSSPGSTTPLHIDPEHNFLLQLQGRKTVHLFDPKDTTVVSDEQRETYFSGPGNHRNQKYKEEFEQKAAVLDLGPGMGLYFPPTAPHWVKNGDEVSISFSITFQSPRLDNQLRVYKVNSVLRKLGWKNPTPFGRSGVQDAAKYNGMRLYSSAKRLLRHK